MRAGDHRRLDRLERSLTTLGVYALEPLSDEQLIQAMTNRTATPAHMKRVYDICAPDLEIRLFQEGTKRRAYPEYAREMRLLQPFDEAAELLRYRVDEEPGFKLEWKPFEPDTSRHR